MGRGQAILIRDHFSAIFGDRRGSGRVDTWEELGQDRIVSGRWHDAGVEPGSGVVFLFPRRLTIGEDADAIGKVERICGVSNEKGECGELLDTQDGSIIYVLKKELIDRDIACKIVADTLSLILENGTRGIEVMVPERFEDDEEGPLQRMVLRPVGSK